MQTLNYYTTVENNKTKNNNNNRKKESQTTKLCNVLEHNIQKKTVTKEQKTTQRTSYLN